jgi:hypothetical protein
MTKASARTIIWTHLKETGVLQYEEVLMELFGTKILRAITKKSMFVAVQLQ